MKYGRDIVAPPGNQAANREYKHQPTLQRLQTTRRGAADRVVFEVNVDWRRPGQRRR